MSTKVTLIPRGDDPTDPDPEQTAHDVAKRLVDQATADYDRHQAAQKGNV